MTNSIGPFNILDHDSLFKLRWHLLPYDCLRLLSASKKLSNEIDVALGDPGLVRVQALGQSRRRFYAEACRINVVQDTVYDMGPPASYPKIRAPSDCRLMLKVQCVAFLLNAIHSREQEQDEKYKQAKMHFFKLYKRSCLPSNVVMAAFVECLMWKAENAFALLDEPPSPSYTE